MGITNVQVRQTPRIGIISSGDEIVPVENDPPPGCMRDVNRFTLGAMARNAYAEPVWIGMATDSLESVSALISQGLESSDAVLISGGSSMGTRDLVIAALEDLPDSKILVHGVSVSPGKPLIVAKVGEKPVFGLPGHPVSAMVSFDQFVVPLIRRLDGEDAVHPFLAPTITAELGRNMPSREGRTDFVRVRLENPNGRIVAVPVLGKSGMISAMVRAHGAVIISNDCEGLYKGDLVTVHLFANWIGEAIEKEHLFGHEASCGGSGDILKPPQQELLSGS
jgi:molybdopterin molybdotransferase